MLPASKSRRIPFNASAIKECVEKEENKAGNKDYVDAWTGISDKSKRWFRSDRTDTKLPKDKLYNHLVEKDADMKGRYAFIVPKMDDKDTTNLKASKPVRSMSFCLKSGKTIFVRP